MTGSSGYVYKSAIGAVGQTFTTIEGIVEVEVASETRGAVGERDRAAQARSSTGNTHIADTECSCWTVDQTLSTTQPHIE